MTTTGVWFKASRSNNGGNCVEVKFGAHSVSIRDSKYRRNPHNDLAAEPIITVPISEWMAFLTTVSDQPAFGLSTMLRACPSVDGAVTLTSQDTKTVLSYTASEWADFVGGVRDGEFDPVDVTAA